MHKKKKRVYIKTIDDLTFGDISKISKRTGVSFDDTTNVLFTARNFMSRTEKVK